MHSTPSTDQGATSDPQHATGDAEQAVRPVKYRMWLQALAALTVASTFLLIGIGGHVTSTGSGLAVPDWPTTFGYDMITAPPRVWAHNIGTFVEHSHRLKGTVVGLLTIALAFSLLFTNFRRPWLVWTGFGLLGAVIVQGILGGFRVTEISYVLAFLHGILGQLVFCVTVLIAAATGRTWLRLAPRVVEWAKQPRWARGMQWLAIAVIGVLVLQLVLGAAVRHAGAGRAIPDFPTAYGKWIPPMSTESLRETATAWEAANPDDAVWLPHNRLDETQAGASMTEPQMEQALWSLLTTQVQLQFAHRLFAIVVLAAVLGLVGWIMWKAPGRGELVTPTMWIAVLILLQVLLGAATVWTQRLPEIATAHQATGALLLAIATWLAARVCLVTGQPETLPQTAPAASETPRDASASAVAENQPAPRLKGAAV
ncbi:MAG: COX15/CtaA family protein [Phycisphaeraceae bacterium]